MAVKTVVGILCTDEYIFTARGRPGESCGCDGCICCNTDVVGVDPNNREPIELDAVWDMPSGPSQHG